MGPAWDRKSSCGKRVKSGGMQHKAREKLAQVHTQEASHGQGAVPGQWVALGFSFSHSGRKSSGELCKHTDYFCVKKEVRISKEV